MLKFAAFTSDIELSFYASLAARKINHDKLDDSTRRLLGFYEIRSSDAPAMSCRMQLHGNALSSEDVPANCFRADGTIKNYNTIEEYRNSDKGAIIERVGRTVWEAILDGTIFSCPSLLASFTVICFSDLKKHKFTYLFGYPALHADPAWTIERSMEITSDVRNEPPHQRVSSEDSVALVEAVQTWRYSTDSRQWGFFLAKRHHIEMQNDGEAETMQSRAPEFASQTKWVIGSLKDFEQGFFRNTRSEHQYVCFADPSTYAEYPGWPLRNLLALVRYRWKLPTVQILCYRDVHSLRHEARSMILRLNCGVDLPSDTKILPKITGWERGPSGKVVSKVANLAEYMDPSKLADQAVDLNLKLIKWRIAPNLNLDVVKNARCLLLGAGTLGSYVSRNLLGWGVRKVTFIDNGNVSFSNPVRQPLYNFEDCLGGGAAKAERAATALKEIYPGVEASGHQMSVPMAGHPVLDEPKTREEYEKLRQLFWDHDVIFLLMDTRESRWLPTVMGKAMGKLVMNAALGFDSYVVMRHGEADTSHPGAELGCYFCNDVVAPADSLSDRTLDQQCTVTRPGVAAIASAMLVEIMVSVLQDKETPTSDASRSGSHPLGEVPHTIRGFLNNWSMMNLSGKAYEQCSACSPTIVQEYGQRGWDFVRQALNEKDYVSELSGLAELQRQAEKAAGMVDWDDDEQASGNLSDEGELI